MSGTDPDIGSEREIDLARWRLAIVARWWVVAAGLLAGAVIGAILSLSGGSVYQASVLISPGQAFSPSGAPVLSYNSSSAGDQLARHLRIGAEAGGAGRPHQRLAAAGERQYHLGVDGHRRRRDPRNRARSHHRPAQEGNSGGDRGKHAWRRDHRPVEVAVREAIGRRPASADHGFRLRNSRRSPSQIQSLDKEIQVPSLDALTKLILVSEANNALLRQASISNDLASAQQQLSLVQTIEYAQRIGPPADAVKTTARSRRNSVLIGALIGLILGAIVAIVADSRTRSR